MKVRSTIQARGLLARFKTTALFSLLLILVSTPIEASSLPWDDLPLPSPLAQALKVGYIEGKRSFETRSSGWIASFVEIKIDNNLDRSMLERRTTSRALLNMVKLKAAKAPERVKYPDLWSLSCVSSDVIQDISASIGSGLWSETFWYDDKGISIVAISEDLISISSVDLERIKGEVGPIYGSLCLTRFSERSQVGQFENSLPYFEEYLRFRYGPPSNKIILDYIEVLIRADESEKARSVLKSLVKNRSQQMDDRERLRVEKLSEQLSES